MTICVIQVPDDFEERYKQYRKELGDKHTHRTLAFVSDTQERAARDLAIINQQVNVFTNQFAAFVEFQSAVKKAAAPSLHFQEVIAAQKKVIEAFNESLNPLLSVTQGLKSQLDRISGPQRELLRVPIETLRASTVGMMQVFNANKTTLSLNPETLLTEEEGVLTVPPTSAHDGQGEQIEILGKILIAVQAVAKKLPEKGKDKLHTFPYTIPAGTRWESIYIAFVDDQMVDIRVAGFVHRTGYADMGFADKRTKNPNLQWGLLLLLARRGGELKASDAEAKPALVKQKELLSSRLRDYFRLEIDPFQPYAQARGYKSKATLVPPEKRDTDVITDDDDQRYYSDLTREG